MFSVGEGTGLAWELARLRLQREDEERSAYLAKRFHETRRDDPLTLEEERRRKREYMQRLRDKARSEPVKSDHPCVVCGGPVQIILNPNKQLCDACRAAGWRAKQCECGAPLHARDTGGAAPWLRGKCGKCRAQLRTREGTKANQEDAA